MTRLGDNLGMDIPTVFERAATIDATRPFITYYDDATGECTELSYATFGNWVAKTANLIIDDAGAEPGDVISVDMPPHWLTGAIMIACWYAGMAIDHKATDNDIVFSTVDRLTSGPGQVYAVSTAPLAMGLRGEEAAAAEAVGAVDYLTEVRAHGDHFRPAAPASAESTALVGLPDGDTVDQRRLVRLAADRVGELGVRPADRVMFSAERLRPIDWLLVPLAVGGSVVVCRNSDPSNLVKRAGAENARHIG